MFFFQLLPAPAPITPYGMKLIGIFIGIIYLWTTEDILWSSILGLVAMVCLGIFTGNELTSAAFGQSLLIMLLFVLAIIFCMDKSGLFDWIANWMLRLKFVQGRPWVLVTMLFALVFVVTLVGNGSLIIFLIWSIIYKIGKKVGYTRENKWMAAMVVGISMTSIVGQHVLPFRPGPLYMLAVFQQTSGIEINAVKYILMQGTLSICLIALYILVMRFVLRLDVSALKEIDMEEFTGERQPMTKQQKFLLFCLFVMVFALILPSILTFLPKNVVTNTIGSLNTVGMSWILFVILCVLHIDGKPVLVFREIADKVLWEMLALMACALTIAPALAGEGYWCDRSFAGDLSTDLWRTWTDLLCSGAEFVLLAGNQHCQQCGHHHDRYHRPHHLYENGHRGQWTSSHGHLSPLDQYGYPDPSSFGLWRYAAFAGRYGDERQSV